MNQADKIAKERYLERLKLIKAGAIINPFETKQQQLERMARAKKDPAYFVQEYLPHYATSKSALFQIKLAKLVLKYPVLQILVMWGRALAKSVWVDVIIPLWLWINDDIRYMVIVGNTEKAAKILLGDIQAEFEANERLIHDFGEQKTIGSWEDGYFETKNGFKAKAFGMRQNVRGLRKGSDRPDYIACDDLEDQDTIKNPKRQREIATWIEKALIPTMDGKRRRFLQANNNFHPSTIMTLLIERHPKWTVNRVDAYDPATYVPAWPEKYDAQYYRDLEEDIGTLAANAEYNNTPHIEGTIFKDEMIHFAERPKYKEFRVIAAHWDVAYSGNNDFNSVRLMGLKDFEFWHLRCFNQQCEMKVAIRWMYMIDSQMPADVQVHWRVERQFWNKPLEDALDEVADEYGYDLRISIVDTPKKNKFDRIITMHPYYQMSRVIYAKELQGNNDTQVAIAHLKGIEPGYTTPDDAPDAEEQCITYLSTFIVRKGKGQNKVEKQTPRRKTWRS